MSETKKTEPTPYSDFGDSCRTKEFFAKDRKTGKIYRIFARVAPAGGIWFGSEFDLLVSFRSEHSLYVETPEDGTVIAYTSLNLLEDLDWDTVDSDADSPTDGSLDIDDIPEEEDAERGIRTLTDDLQGYE